MSTYWHRHPRNFANECSLLRADTNDEATRLESLGYSRLTRKDLAHHIRWMNGENASWGSGRAIGDYDFRALVDPTHDAWPLYSARTYLADVDRAAELDRLEEAYYASQEAIECP